MNNHDTLKVIDFTVSYAGKEAVREVSFTAHTNACFCIIGESGSGKSSLLRGILGLRRASMEAAGKVEVSSVEKSEWERRGMLGKEWVYIPQNAVLAMNPVKRIRSLYMEYIHLHGDRRTGKKECIKIAKGLLERVGLTDTERILKSYPFELSGGMCQKILISLAFFSRPRFIFADEITSALDSVSTFEVLDELWKLKKESHAGMILISHQLHLVRSHADEIAVMQNGRIVEAGTADSIFCRPQHPYTKELLHAEAELGW